MFNDRVKGLQEFGNLNGFSRRPHERENEGAGD